jgi:hypothetical protein
MKHSVERSRNSNQMKRNDRDKLLKLLEEMTPEEILEVKSVIDEIEQKRNE